MRMRRLFIIMLVLLFALLPTARAAGVFLVPSGLDILESGCFEGISFPKGVFIPSSFSVIAPDAFDPKPSLILGQADSYAESYAAAIGTHFTAVSMRSRLNTLYLNVGMSADATNILALSPADSSLWQLSWSSSNPSCASVSDNGTIKAIAKGSCIVTASSTFGVVERIMVTVVSSGTVITSQGISSSYLVLKRGETATLSASCSSCSSQYKSGIWYSDNPAVVSVPEGSDAATVTVSAVGAGTANVYVLSSSGIVAKCEILVNPVVIGKLSLSSSALDLVPGESQTLTAILQPADADAEISWSSSHSDVASVDDNGRVTARKGGSAVITALTPDGISAACSVTVASTPMTEAFLTETAISGFAGETHALTYTFSPAQASPAEFLWVSDDADIAAVNAATGEITFMSAGTTTVRGTATDGSELTLACEVAVSEIPVETFALDVGFLSLNAGETYSLSSTVTPENASHRQPRYTVSDPQIAMVDKDGTIYALSAGSAVISATVGRGDYETTNFVAVSVINDNPVDYRLLVINEYSAAGVSGFLPFSNNSTVGVRDALSRSTIDGMKYESFFYANPAPTAFRSAIRGMANLADENDVTVIYILTHGSYNTKEGYYMGTTSGTKILGSDLIPALKEISGHVVLVLCSCHSGRILSLGAVSSLMGQGGAYTGNNGPGKLSILCSATDTKSCYYDTSNTSASYDFFSYAFTRALGWDMIADSALGSPLADSNKDGQVTLSEIAAYCRVNTQRYVSSFIQLHGTSNLNGNPNQYPTWKFASGEGDLVLFSTSK